MSQRNTRLIGGAYRIGQIVTSNNQITIYTAYNHNTNDVVGLFVIDLPPTEHLDKLPTLLKQFEQRQAMQSPHVLSVHDWGIDGIHVYITTDPPRGVTLQHVLDTENVGIPRILEMCRQIATGLQALHIQGLAGFDLRPQLITVDTIDAQDRVQIDDIGLRGLFQSLRMLHPSLVADRSYLDPRYLAPEYIHNSPIGPWSDIYQLGILFFSLLTGRLPFVGRTPTETGILQCNGPLPRMNQFDHNITDELQKMVERMMAKEPDKRFPSAATLIAALEKQLKPYAQAAPAISPVQEIVSNDQTSEIAHLKEEISRITTQKDPQPSINPTTSSMQEATYAYLCHEGETDAETIRIPIMQANVIVGRLDPKRNISPDVDLSIVDPKKTISRLHVRIRCENTFFYIEDLKSRNKTRLGTNILQPLKPELLKDGDTLFCGSVRLRFEVSQRQRASIAKEDEAK